MAPHAVPARPQRARVTFFDTLRGLTIISMVLFHACYDLAYLAGVALPWFTGTLFQTVWRSSISWTFLFLAGWMTRFSRNNVRRAAIYAVAAILVFVATSLAGVDTAVNFGIIFCMAASTALYALLEPVLKRIPAPVGIVASLALFALTYGLPAVRYPITGFAWLGFPGPTFRSGDYYPLMPFGFMYLTGAFVGRFVEERLAARGAEAYPRWMLRDWCPPLTAIGRASLIIYLVHQPVLLVLTELIVR